MALLMRRQPEIIDEPPIDVVERVAIYEVTRLPAFGRDVTFVGALRRRSSNSQPETTESVTDYLLTLPA